MKDVISMARVGNSVCDGEAAHFSPDGTKVVVVIRKGNLRNNTNEYSLLFWKSAELFSSPSSDVLVTMSSSSNREGIRCVTWMHDDVNILFMGEQPRGLQQLYELNTRTHALTRISNHPTNVVDYGVIPTMNRVAYIAEAPAERLVDQKARHEGIVVSTQQIDSLLAGKQETGDLGNNQLFLLDRLGTHQLHVAVKISVLGPCALSPDGRYVIVRAHVERIPEIWKEYDNYFLKKFTERQLAAGQYSILTRYILVDTATGESKILLDSPVPNETLVAWSPDGHSVAVAGVYLPLDKIDNKERATRRSKTFVVEVKVPSCEVAIISEESEIGLEITPYSRALRWDGPTNSLVYEARTSATPQRAPAVRFGRRGGKWEKVGSGVPDHAKLEIRVEEDMNQPPRIFAIDSIANRETMLLDLNPGFKVLNLAKVEEIEWQGSDGHEVKGGLYFPINYSPGIRYPLVIQTHGWSSEKFWIDGPYSTANAAQPLAARGIMVLQVDELSWGTDYDTIKEQDREVSSFEGAIDALDEKGLIDRNRVGIIGFSRTGCFVLFALTHSKYHFAAASVADGADLGYFQYILSSHLGPDHTEPFEQFYGGPPFGETLKSWIAEAPEFTLDRVQTPLRILATHHDFLRVQWAWFTSLVRLGKPVEMVYLPDGTHVLQKPWERMVSQQGNVDWFVFWLNGEEDHDPHKIEMYTRWRQLRVRHNLSTSPVTGATGKADLNHQQPY